MQGGSLDKTVSINRGKTVSGCQRKLCSWYGGDFVKLQWKIAGPLFR